MKNLNFYKDDIKEELIKNIYLLRSVKKQVDHSYFPFLLFRLRLEFPVAPPLSQLRFVFDQHSFAVSLVIQPIPNEHRPVGEHLLAASMELVVLPLSFVLVPVREVVGAESLLRVVGELPLVVLSVVVDFFASAVSLVVFELAFVHVVVAVDEFAEFARIVNDG